MEESAAAFSGSNPMVNAVSSLPSSGVFESGRGYSSNREGDRGGDRGRYDEHMGGHNSGAVAEQYQMREEWLGRTHHNHHQSPSHQHHGHQYEDRYHNRNQPTYSDPSYRAHSSREFGSAVRGTERYYARDTPDPRFRRERSPSPNGQYGFTDRR